MPPSQYHKPETALTKARELIKCDKKSNALEILYEVMRVRRTKQWQKVLEELMMLFVELCVELRKNIHFRKAIYTYKNMSVMENTISLEQVIRYYLNQIKGKTEEAQEVSKSAIMEIEDLDVLETPESLMLNAVSMEGTQDRSARTILMPWLKFLWDSYRLVLDLLRSNSKLEKLYHEVAHDAYNFCLKYGRKTEFKKLCELSTHVNDPDKLSRQLTMFAQVMQQITDILEVGQSLANCRRALVQDYRKNEKVLRSELLNRRCLIEARKEEIETYQGKRDQYYSIVEARRQAEQERLLKAEETNLANEAIQRERMKTEDEKARLKLRMARTSLKMFLDLKIDTKLDLKELTEEQLENFDADKLINKQKQEVKKKRKELAEKAKTMAKKLDYYTRACRIEEIPLLQAKIEPEAIESRELFEQSVREIEEHSKAEHARQLKERNRLIRMKSDVQRLVGQLKEARDNRYRAKLAEWEALCDQKRSERLAERRAKHEAELEAEARRRAAQEALEREEQKQRELAAEAERQKREQEAKEAAEREAARIEEESKAWTRGDIKRDEPVSVNPFARHRQSEINSASGNAFRDFRRDDTSRYSDFGRSSGSKRVGFDNTPTLRSDSSKDTWSRSGPRRTVPSEFDSLLYEDDSGNAGGWTQVGSRRETERTRPFGRGGSTMGGGFNRASKNLDMDTGSSTPWRREGPNATAGKSQVFEEMRGGNVKRPFGSSGFPSRLSSGLSDDRKY
ncbi:unnamed protein product [Schistosoma margrebowiei]|uniref:eIF3a PCI domain-containing protein n=1 Tax=Schistosoma margrebowiei TaxID=48269 RepID=A0AA85A7L4_9TREM|nr:unnamed protein product [Schistosoma margrebowiei]